METVKGRLCLGTQYDCIQAENTGLVESHKYWVSGKSLERQFWVMTLGPYVREEIISMQFSI